jgi:hypothetical protein
MRNTLALPIISLIFAVGLVIAVLISYGDETGPLSELELGGVAWAVGLAVYGVQGLISVLLEGRELRPGRTPPRLTGPLSVLIVLGSLALIGIAATLAVGLVDDWRTSVLGSLAGAGCLVMALLFIFYKEAFFGDEATFDNRDDGVPW